MLGCFFLSSLFVAASTFGSFPPTPHQLLWLFCVARRHQLLDHPPLYFLCGLPLPSRSDTSAQRHFCAASATQVYSALEEGAVWRKGWTRPQGCRWNLKCMSSTCSFCRIFNDYRESQLMDNNSFDVRWVTAHGPRHSALVKPFLEKRGPQGLEPWGVMCFGWAINANSSLHIFCWVSCIPKQLIMQRCA